MGRKRKNEDTETKSEGLSQAELDSLLKNCIVHDTKNPAQPIIWRVKSVPEQKLRDKIGHDMAYTVCNSGTDFENKKIWIDRITTIDHIERTEFTFEAVAKMFGWESFSFSRDKTIIKPKWAQA